MKVFSRNKLIGLLCLGIIFLCTSGVLAAKSNFFQKILSQKENKPNLALFDISSLDSDSDGLSDKKEQELGTNLYNSDSDGDGYSDLEEVKSNHDPLKQESTLLADEDNDGLIGEDEKKYGTNPKNSDSDFDGYSDGEEIIWGHDPLVANFSLLEPVFKNLGQAIKENQNITCSTGNCSSSADLASALTNLGTTNFGAGFGAGNNFSQNIISQFNQFKLDSSTASNLENLANAKDISSLQSNLLSSLGLDQSKFNFNKQVNLPEVPEGEIKILKNTSKQAIQEYFNILGITLYKNSPIRSVEEAQNYAQGLDISDTKQVEKILSVVSRIKSGIKVIEVPEKRELIDFHKKVLATAIYFENLLSELKAINFKDTDSLYSLVNLLPRFAGLNEFIFGELLHEAEKISKDFGVEIPKRNFLEKFK